LLYRKQLLSIPTQLALAGNACSVPYWIGIVIVSQDLVQEIDAGGSTGTAGAGHVSGQEINGNSLNNSVVVRLSLFWSQQLISVALRKRL